MITRTAIFEGQVKAGHEDEFFRRFEQELPPIWREFPHASNIRLFRVQSGDEGAPPICMIQQIDYPSLAALEEAIASPARQRARALTLELMEMFNGRFYHLVSGGNAVSGDALP
jgi:hypothetical protein